MIRSSISIVFLLLASTISHAQVGEVSEKAFQKSHEQSILLGHNLSPTTNTVPKGKLSAGNYSLSYGLSDQWMVSTSPWLLVSYNMPMINLKYSFDAGEIFDRISIEQSYFKTFEYGFDDFQQESTWTRVTAMHEFSKNYQLNTCLGVQYFWDDRSPYSMRPIPTNHTPITISLSTLHQFSFNENWGAFLEGGFLGVNYPNRYLQYGASGFYRWSTGYIQLGLSQSISLGNEPITKGQFTKWINSRGESHASVFERYEAPFHPEVQIQFLL